MKMYFTKGSARARLMASTMIGGLTLAVMASAPAFAQESTELEAVVVTGSRIPQPNLETTSPVTQVTSADILKSGVSRVEDLVNQLPQAFAAQNSNISNGASGTATVDLRGLGSDRTLVLIDGRRMPYGSTSDTAADLNQIPGGLIDRVEVLTGGASAVYGSDALAGVVNFIMKKNFEGVRLDAQYTFFQHNNDFDGRGNIRNVIAGRAATNPAQFALPDDNVTDGVGKEVTLMLGVSSPDDKGNITAYATYRKNDAVLQRDRDFSACSIGVAGATAFTCGGSGTSYPGQFTDFSNYAYTVGGTAASPTFINYNGNLHAYNFGPLNYYQRPDERYTFGAMGHYEINEHAEAYAQLMFADYSTVAQIAPSGDFFSTASLNCDNPLMSAQQTNAIGCSPAMIAAGDTVPTYIARRNVEGGGRQDDRRFESYRSVVGLRGAINANWNYDLYGQYSRVQETRVYRNEFSISRLTKSLDVVAGPGGVPTCRSVINGTDTNCVPYNIFALGGVTQAALNYLQIPLVQTGFTTQQVVSGSINGDLTPYGIKSPLADDGIRVALGVEYRRDVVGRTVDVTFATGDGAGQGGPTQGINGATSVTDLFVEAQVPLVSGKPFAESIALDLAYRNSDYASGITTDTYKVGLEWAPTADIKFRASYQEAVRAANVVELFAAQGFNLFDMDADPCGPNPTATQAQCVATGVPLANYGATALDSPAGQYNFLGGGNPGLKPEESTTKTFGVVFTPSFVPGLNVSIDYFEIQIDGLVSTFGAQNAVDACYGLSNAQACSAIHRNGAGQLWVGTGYVSDLNTNIGYLKTSGVDLNFNYRLSLGDMGSLAFQGVGTYLSTLETKPNAVIPAYDCVGYYANQCGIPNPAWRHRFSSTWETPWNGSVTATWRYFDEVKLYAPGNTAVRVDRYFDEENYLDVSTSWKFGDNVTWRLGVNNILDNDPQLTASAGTTGNGNTYPQVYDSLGRYVFTGLTLDF